MPKLPKYIYIYTYLYLQKRLTEKQGQLVPRDHLITSRKKNRRPPPSSTACIMPVKQAQSVVFLLWVHTLHVMESMYPQQKHKERHTVNKATWERNRLLSQTAGSPHVLDSMSAVIQGMTMFGWGGISIALEQCCFFSDLSLGKGTFEETKFHHTPNTEQLLFHGLAGLSGFIIDSLAIMDSSVHSPCGYFEVRLGKLGKLGNQILAFPKKNVSQNGWFITENPI